MYANPIMCNKKSNNDQEFTVPLELIPHQFKYLHNFFAMNVFPLAGKPTMTIRVGTLTNLGFTAG